MAQATTLLLIMLSLSSSPSFLTTFFGANALPIDPSATNSSSTESLGSRMFTPENAKQANFLLGYTYVNTVRGNSYTDICSRSSSIITQEIGTDYNTATQFTAAHHFEPGPLGSVGKYLSPRPAQIHELIPGATMEVLKRKFPVFPDDYDNITSQPVYRNGEEGFGDEIWTGEFETSFFTLSFSTCQPRRTTVR